VPLIVYEPHDKIHSDFLKYLKISKIKRNSDIESTKFSVKCRRVVGDSANSEELLIIIIVNWMAKNPSIYKSIELNNTS
jgi:hypothetical protein